MYFFQVRATLFSFVFLLCSLRFNLSDVRKSSSTSFIFKGETRYSLVRLTLLLFDITSFVQFTPRIFLRSNTLFTMLLFCAFPSDGGGIVIISIDCSFFSDVGRNLLCTSLRYSTDRPVVSYIRVITRTRLLFHHSSQLRIMLESFISLLYYRLISHIHTTRTGARARALVTTLEPLHLLSNNRTVRLIRTRIPQTLSSQA